MREVTILLGFLLVLAVTDAKGGRGGGGRSGGGGGFFSRGSSSSSSSRSSSWFSRSSSRSRSSSSSSSGGSSYPRQQWGSSGTPVKSPSPIGGGGFVNPRSGPAAFKPNPAGTSQYSAWSKPKAALGSYSGAGGTKYGYKTKGYGSNWGTNFNGCSACKYKAKKGISKKALGLGVAAGFVGGAALGAAGAMATYSVYHRYHAFQQMMYMRHPSMYGNNWDNDYYANYYSK